MKKLTKQSLRKVILQEMKILEACGEVKAGKKPCSACMKGGSCGGHDRHKEDQGDHHKPHEREGRMTKAHLYHMMKYASGIYDMIDDSDDLPEWVQSKIARAVEKISSVYHYMDSHENQPESIGHM